MSTAIRLPRETWERVKAADAERVAELLGLERARERHKWECPKHGGSDSLHSYAADKGGGFYCFACGEHFSTVDLAAIAWNVAAGEACERLAQALGIPTADNRPSRMPQAARSAPPTIRRPRLERAPKRHPEAEVLALWERTVAADDDPEASAWLVSRGLDPSTVARRNLARALPRGVPVPSWAACGRPWNEGPWRLLVPLYGATGRLEGLHARAIVADEKRKSLHATGASSSGLVFADSLGLWLLEGRPPEWWAKPWRVVIAEGVPDFLTLATHHSDDEGERAPAVLGVFSGAWTPELAARIPDGARVLVWSHGDAAGERYLQTIVSTLKGRCEVLKQGGANGR
jgi:hypothetical protein